MACCSTKLLVSRCHVVTLRHGHTCKVEPYNQVHIHANVYKICHGVTARQCYLQSLMSNSAAAASTLKLRCEFAVLSSGTAATTETNQKLCADICMCMLCCPMGTSLNEYCAPPFERFSCLAQWALC